MKKSIIGIFLFLAVAVNAQNVPLAEPVDGGYIEEIDAVKISSDTTRVFIATRAANALFYTDVSYATGTPTFSRYQVVPDFDVSANTDYIRFLAADEKSHFVFTAFESGGLWGADISSGSAYAIDSDFIEALEAYNGYLFYIKKVASDEIFYFTPISSSGTTGTIDNTTVEYGVTWTPQFKVRIMVNPSNRRVYIFVPGVSPTIYESSDAYDSLSSATTFAKIATSDLSGSAHEYVAMGIAPDGRIYVAAYEGNSSSFNAWFAYSDNDGDPWTINSISKDIGRGEFSIVGDTSNYYIYYSRVASSDKGSSWLLAHDRADGALKGDPINPAYAYVRTDWGMGIYSIVSDSTTETNEGIQAVQVKAIGMNKGKSTAFVASKSGIWYVYNYNSSMPSWSSPIWPNDDSTPYTSVVTDTSGNIAYAGNTSGKLYKYDSSAGAPDDPLNWQIIFDAQSGSTYPHWSWTYGTRISAIAIDHSSATERIFIGLYDDEDFNETTQHNGTVFVGENSGSSWSWTQITSSVIPDGIDVNDIVVTRERGNTVLYVGVDRNTAFSPTINGIYRMEETAPGSWTVTQDLFLSSSYSVAATIYDIAKSPSDTLYACGTDASHSNPVIYKKAVGDTYWTAVASYGFGSSDKIARSITFDPTGNIYIAVNNNIYIHTASASSWTLFYGYPVGTEINFIYYDDLLVGTGTGLYVHPGKTTGIKSRNNLAPLDFELKQNYPNPFNPTTTIEYSVPDFVKMNEAAPRLVELKIYDVLGREVRTVVSKIQKPGNYSVQFDADKLPSGIYFYKLKAGSFTAVKKMILLK